MKKILGYGLMAGLLMIAVSFILNFIFAWMFPSFNAIYENTAIFKAMNDPMMYLFWFYPLVLGVSFAWVWDKTKKLFTAKTTCKKGFDFATAYLFITIIPAFFINVGSFNLPTMMIFSWAVMSFVTSWSAGCLLAKLNK